MKHTRHLTLVTLAACLLASPPRGHAQRAPETRGWPTVQLQLSDTTGVSASLQEQGRYTRTGAIVGAIAGTVVGLGIGAFIALYCEADGDGDGCGGVLPAITLIGAVSGAISGAIIGAAIPRGPRPVAQPEVAQPRRRIGSASFSVGGAAVKLNDELGVETRGNGQAFRANLYAELKPWLAIGPEAGIATFDASVGNVRHGAVAVRLSRDLPRFTPYVGLSLGAYDSTKPALEYLGGAVAAGSRIDAARSGRFYVDVEVRHSRNAQNIEPMRMGVLSAGFGTYW